tara:strand:- start:2428 stop:2694 length:267 start_codon:yes stop_codon:yes gene_type:complete
MKTNIKQFMTEVTSQTDASDVWSDSENGKKYIVVEMEGMSRQAEKQLRTDVKIWALHLLFKYVGSYHIAQKLGIEGAYCDDAILIYVG